MGKKNTKQPKKLGMNQTVVILHVLLLANEMNVYRHNTTKFI